MRKPSIMQDDRRCIVSGFDYGLDAHHIYFGNSNRLISNENGFWCYLRHDIHMALHARQKPFEKLDEVLKIRCQAIFEANGGTREEFMRLIGRNYL